MNIEEINKRIAECNPERLVAYQNIFDKLLLFSIASSLLSTQEIEKVIDFADTVIKKTINTDSVARTAYQQETKAGRLARMENDPDGEDIRLEYLKTWNLAKELIRFNLVSKKKDDLDNNGIDVDQ